MCPASMFYVWLGAFEVGEVTALCVRSSLSLLSSIVLVVLKTVQDSTD